MSALADPPLADCTAYQIDILLALARGGPQTGAKVRERLRARHGEQADARPYRNLDDLAEEGLVEKESIDRRSNSYALTPAGYQQLEEYLAYVERHVEDDPLATAERGVQTDGTLVGKEPSLTPPERALIVIYCGLGLYDTEIADRLHRHRDSVANVREQVRSRVLDTDDPLDVFADVVAPALGTDPEAEFGGDDDDA